MEDWRRNAWEKPEPAPTKVSGKSPTDFYYTESDVRWPAACTQKQELWDVYDRYMIHNNVKNLISVYLGTYVALINLVSKHLN